MPGSANAFLDDKGIAIVCGTDLYGAITCRGQKAELTLACFDGDNGEYFLLLVNAKEVDGQVSVLYESCKHTSIKPDLYNAI